MNKLSQVGIIPNGMYNAVLELGYK